MEQPLITTWARDTFPSCFVLPRLHFVDHHLSEICRVLDTKMQYLRRDKKDEEDGKKFYYFLSYNFARICL